MAIKKIQIKPPDNSYADVLHPETDSTQVLMNGGNTLQIDFDAHQVDTMPHRFTDTGTSKTYKWGLKVTNGIVSIIYEEVI